MPLGSMIFMAFSLTHGDLFTTSFWLLEKVQTVQHGISLLSLKKQESLDRFIYEPFLYFLYTHDISKSKLAYPQTFSFERRIFTHSMMGTNNSCPKMQPYLLECHIDHELYIACSEIILWVLRAVFVFLSFFGSR